jgi:flavin reductase (DIM6/NTAB) family NADH-FMN oxidoreductase RutF
MRVMTSLERSTSELPGGETGIDPVLFREVLASFPAGVVIVTAIADDAIPSGVTVSAFCSVSAMPTLVLVCIDKSSRTLAAIKSAAAFTVNILPAGREDLAIRFASKSDEKFAGVEWEPSIVPNGGPILHVDSAAHLVCQVHDEVEAGDHWIFVGRVLDAGIRDNQTRLLYHERGFASVG